jgi:hypothetical protein
MIDQKDVDWWANEVLSHLSKKSAKLKTLEFEGDVKKLYYGDGSAHILLMWASDYLKIDGERLYFDGSQSGFRKSFNRIQEILNSKISHRSTIRRQVYRALVPNAEADDEQSYNPPRENRFIHNLGHNSTTVIGVSMVVIGLAGLAIPRALANVIRPDKYGMKAIAPRILGTGAEIAPRAEFLGLLSASACAFSILAGLLITFWGSRYDHVDTNSYRSDQSIQVYLRNPTAAVKVPMMNFLAGGLDDITPLLTANVDKMTIMNALNEPDAGKKIDAKVKEAMLGRSVILGLQAARDWGGLKTPFAPHGDQ